MTAALRLGSASLSDRATTAEAHRASALSERSESKGPLVPTTADTDLIHFSSVSGNTDHFIQKLGLPSTRIPLYPSDPPLKAAKPYVLVVPTYGGGEDRGAVPKQVIRFLNDPENRALIRGVIATGNTNFGTAYGIAGDIIAAKCQVPCLYRFELFGTPDDVDIVRTGLEQFWMQQ
jgi:protein involved in ribonucleotide reduction